MSAQIRIKRAYDPPLKADGVRVLVDRIWPRGLSRASARIDVWLKAVAPSHELRAWFDHALSRWPEFRRRYRAELEGSPALEQLADLTAFGTVTLLFAARDADHNNAAVLAAALRHRLETRDETPHRSL